MFKVANEIQWANGVTLKNDYMFVCPKIAFSYKWIFEQLFLQIILKVFIIVQVHDMFFLFISFENVLTPCKFNVSFFKKTTISNHNHKLIFLIFMFSCIINHNFS